MPKPFKQSFSVPGGVIEIVDRSPKGDPTFRADFTLDDGKTYATALTAKEAMSKVASYLRHIASKIDEIAEEIETP